MKELYHSLLKDLKAVGIKQDFDLVLKPYSKTYYGRYDPNTNKVLLYVYRDKECTEYIEYEELFMTLVHEMCHCIQWHDNTFVRLKGIMHDTNFYKMYNKYIDLAKACALMKEVRSNDNLFQYTLLTC